MFFCNHMNQMSSRRQTEHEQWCFVCHCSVECVRTRGKRCLRSPSLSEGLPRSNVCLELGPAEPRPGGPPGPPSTALPASCPRVGCDNTLITLFCPFQARNRIVAQGSSRRLIYCRRTNRDKLTHPSELFHENLLNGCSLKVQ